MFHWLVFVVDFQETVVKTLGNKLDNDTLETFALAEQLSTNLTDLNVRIEGTKQLCSSATDSFVLFVLYLMLFLRSLSRPTRENKYYWPAFGNWFCRLHTALTIHLCIMHRDDPWLGAVQCSSGCGSRGGQTEHRGGPGNGDLDEEDGSVPTRAHCHRRVDWSPWLWGDILQFTKHKCKQADDCSAYWWLTIILIVIISISQDKAFMKLYPNDLEVTVSFFYHGTTIVKIRRNITDHHVQSLHVSRKLCACEENTLVISI